MHTGLRGFASSTVLYRTTPGHALPNLTHLELASFDHFHIGHPPTFTALTHLNLYALRPASVNLSLRCPILTHLRIDTFFPWLQANTHNLNGFAALLPPTLTHFATCEVDDLSLPALFARCPRLVNLGFPIPLPVNARGVRDATLDHIFARWFGVVPPHVAALQEVTLLDGIAAGLDAPAAAHVAQLTAGAGVAFTFR